MADDDIQREVLPIPDRPYAGGVVDDAKDPAATFPPITPLRPPAGTRYVKDGRLCYGFSFIGLEHTTSCAGTPVPADTRQVRVEFAYEGGLGKGGNVTLFVDGQPVSSGRIPRTHPLSFSLDQTTDVSRDTGAPVTPDYPVGDKAFTATVKGVRLEVGDDSHDHLIDAHDLLHLAMTNQ